MRRRVSTAPLLLFGAGGCTIKRTLARRLVSFLSPILRMVSLVPPPFFNTKMALAVLVQSEPLTGGERLSGANLGACGELASHKRCPSSPSSPSRPPIPGRATHASARMALVAAQERRTSRPEPCDDESQDSPLGGMGAPTSMELARDDLLLFMTRPFWGWLAVVHLVWIVGDGAFFFLLLMNWQVGGTCRREHP